MFESTNDETITGNICEINSCVIFKDGAKRGKYSWFLPTSDSDHGAADQSRFAGHL